MTHPWQVSTMMDDGSSYQTVVLARSAADAGLLVGSMIRAARGVDLSGEVGIWDQDVRRLSDEYVKIAVNQVFRAFPKST